MKLIETLDKRIVNWDSVASLEFDHDQKENTINCIACINPDLKMKIFKIKTGYFHDYEILYFITSIYKWISFSKKEMIEYKEILEKSIEIMKNGHPRCMDSKSSQDET